MAITYSDSCYQLSKLGFKNCRNVVLFFLNKELINNIPLTPLNKGELNTISNESLAYASDNQTIML